MLKVRDALWETVEPMLPDHVSNPRGGRPRVDDRVCFNAIAFVFSRASPGGIYPGRSAARRLPRTAALPTGSAPECSSVCIVSYFER